MPTTSCCLQLSVKGGGGGGLFFCFLAGLDGAVRSNEMVCVTNWGKGRGGKLCGNEERRGDEGRAEGGKSVKKCRVEGFGRAESALMQTLWGGSHTYTDTHTCTQPSSEFFCSTVTNIFHIRMSYWAESALGTATPCCAVRLLHGLTELN